VNRCANTGAQRPSMVKAVFHYLVFVSARKSLLLPACKIMFPYLENPADIGGKV